MKTLEVTIPDKIFGVLSSLTNHQDKFVLEAIREKLEREAKPELAEKNKVSVKNNLSAESKKLRPFGLSKNKFVVPNDFDSPLPDDVLVDFEN